MQSPFIATYCNRITAKKQNLRLFFLQNRKKETSEEVSQ